MRLPLPDKGSRASAGAYADAWTVPIVRHGGRRTGPTQSPRRQLDRELGDVPASKAVVRVDADRWLLMGDSSSGSRDAFPRNRALAYTRKQWWPESDGPLATDSHRAIQLAREAACRARQTSKRLSSADQSRRHSAKARAHRPTARRLRPRRSVSALMQPEAAPSEGRSTPAMFVYPGRAQRRTNSPTKCESSPNGSNAMGAGA
jgi:hypothetical protein